MLKNTTYKKKLPQNLGISNKRPTFASLFGTASPTSHRKREKHRGVAQLVAHLVWDQVVARSSRVTPTKDTREVYNRLNRKLEFSTPIKTRNSPEIWQSQQNDLPLHQTY